MKKWIVFSSLLSLLLLSSCSWKPEKEIITKAEVYVPTINVVPRPEPLTLQNADVIVITEKNLKEVIQRVKDMQGSFVVYALDPKSFESLAINMEQIKLYIEKQKQIILYYEKAVTNEKKENYAYNLTVLIYLAKGWKHGEAGGTYLASDEDESSIIFEPNNLDNTCVIFAETPRSFHGSRYMTKDTKRQSIQFTLI